MKCYVDSSVVLRHLMTDDPGFLKAAAYDKVGASELLVIECLRVIERYRLEGLIDDLRTAELRQDLRDIVSGMFLLALTAEVKKRAAESFPTVIGTLDALHLSTAMAWRGMDPPEGIVVSTYDAQMATCARALGITLLPPTTAKADPVI